MNILGWLIVGSLAGWIASLIAPTDVRQGWVMNLVVGVVGAIFGGLLWSFLIGMNFVGTFNTFDLATLLIATLGAVLVLVLYKAVASRTV